MAKRYDCSIIKHQSSVVTLNDGSFTPKRRRERAEERDRKKKKKERKEDSSQGEREDGEESKK